LEPSGHPDRAGNLSKNRLAVLGTAYVGVLSRERVSSSDEFNPCACSHQYAPLTPARRAINCFIPNLRNSPALTSLYHDQYSWLLQRFPSRSQEAYCGSLQPAPLLQSPAEDEVLSQLSGAQALCTIAGVRCLIDGAPTCCMAARVSLRMISRTRSTPG
jgi:hypothetical protein